MICDERVEVPLERGWFLLPLVHTTGAVESFGDSTLMEQTTLKVLLKDWVDWDGAAYCLGMSLGLIPDAQGRVAPKYVFWSNHPTGLMLSGMLDDLVKQGVLEKRDEPDFQYRWNVSFRGWEDAAV